MLANVSNQENKNFLVCIKIKKLYLHNHKLFQGSASFIAWMSCVYLGSYAVFCLHLILQA